MLTAGRCRTRGAKAGEKARKGSTLALKPRADVPSSPKQGYQWPHKKDLYPPKKFKTKSMLTAELNELISFWITS